MPRSLWEGSFAQIFQKALIKEYALNYSMDPHMIQGIFLNQGLLEALGGKLDSRRLQVATAVLRGASEGTFGIRLTHAPRLPSCPRKDPA